MAVLGHSGSQAPQLMHSLVITVAIGWVLDAGLSRAAPPPAECKIPNVFWQVGQTAARSLGSARARARAPADGLADARGRRRGGRGCDARAPTRNRPPPARRPPRRPRAA